MAEFDDGRYALGEADIAQEQRDEFIADTSEDLEALDAANTEARHGRKPLDSLIGDLRRLALPLNGKSAHYGLRILGFVAHRLQDYLAALDEATPVVYDDIQAYIDVMTDIVNGEIKWDVDPSVVVRRLPSRATFNVEDVDVTSVEILLVMLHGAQTRFVERELQQCGYRVSVVTSTFDALPMAVRIKPDMIIVSALMPELDGIDLAVALTAMPTTRNIPLALITSLDPRDQLLEFLPKHVPVVRKGAKFGDDLTDALGQCFLL